MSMQYLMENDEEALRLDLKTDPEKVKIQACWAGLGPGMRVADLGCGSGKTSAILHELVQPGGSVVGVDLSENRWEYARHHYDRPGLEFKRLDIRKDLGSLGTFDFVWIRFVLEYYLQESLDLVCNAVHILRPGGILCLIDLDHNCLSHYGLSDRLSQTIEDLKDLSQKKANFDPYVGRKLYSYLYDLGFKDIQVEISAHHLFFGEIEEKDAFNWLKKVETGPKKLGYTFPAYQGSYQEFLKDYLAFFHSPRRFTYTPLICCRGLKPSVPVPGFPPPDSPWS